MSTEDQRFNYFFTPLPQARGLFKLESNRRWGLAATRAWARLLIDRTHILVLGGVRLRNGCWSTGTPTTVLLHTMATAIDTAPMAGAEGGDDK
jgi:hypothetical protein